MPKKDNIDYDISIIIPWRDIGQQDRNDIAEWCFERYKYLFPEAELIISDSGEEVFSRGGSINKGVQAAKGSYIIITDADYLFSATMARQIINKQAWTVAVKSENYFFLNRGVTNKILQENPSDFDIKNFNFEDSATNSSFIVYGGMLAMPKENFLQVQFDTKFNGYGYEDNGFYWTMKAFFGKEYRTGLPMYHMCHERTAGSIYMQKSYANKDYYDKVYKPILYDKKALRQLVETRRTSV